MTLFYLKKYGLLLLLFLICSPIVMAQTGSITGQVLDETKQPLAGAAVYVEGTEIATQTDVNGNFRLSGINFGNVSVTAKFIGYTPKTQSLNLNGNTGVLNFSME